MELRHLRYFAAVGGARHFRRAAQELRVAQPALTRQIKALEAELGVALFERVSRGVRLTGPGEVFLEDAKRILAEVEVAADRARRIAAGQIGNLRLACSEAVSAHAVVTETIRSFRAEEANVELVLQHMVSSAQLVALRAGQIDAGFVFRAPGTAEEFAIREIDVVDAVIAMPEAHPLARRPRLRLADLAGESLVCIARRINPHFHDSLTAACAGGGLVPHVIQETSSGIILSLVAVGMGIGVISAAMQWRLPSGIVLRRVEDLSIPSHLDLIWRHDNRSSVLQRFVGRAGDVADRLRPSPTPTLPSSLQR